MRFTRTRDKILFIDTSAFVAIANEGDIWHSDSAKFLDDIKSGKTTFRTLVTSDYIIDETITRIRFSVGHKEAVKWGDKILSSAVIDVISVDKEIFDKAWDLFKRYEDKELSFTDCTSFVIMKGMNIRHAFAFDEDFERLGFKQLP